MHFDVVSRCFQFQIFSFCLETFVFAYLIVCFFSRNLFDGRSRGCCNEAWPYVIRLDVMFCYEFFKLKHLFFYLIWLTIKSKIKMSSGRSIMCERTLASLLCMFYSFNGHLLHKSRIRKETKNGFLLVLL